MAQIEQERRITLQEKKTEPLEAKHEDLAERQDGILQALKDMPLNNTQRDRLKGLIDSKAKALANWKVAGAIQRELKEHFTLNTTNSHWYDVPQGKYEEAVEFVGRW